MRDNLTDSFISDIYSLSQMNYSNDLIHQAKRCLLDYLGCAFYGAFLLKEKGEKLIDSYSKDIGSISVIGFDQKLSLENAVLINGLSAHIGELDDGVISGIVHPGSPVITALLSVAEKEEVSGDDFLKGIIIGYEVTTRIADTIQPSHKRLGFHASATCGTLGAVLGISAMLNLNQSQMKNAFSIASSSAYGTLKVLEDDSELKPYNIARASLDSVRAIYMAKAGFKGPDDVLSGNVGFLAMMTEEYQISKLIKRETEQFAIERVYVKPYAACRYCHPAIDAILKIKSNCVITNNDIQSINVSTYKLAVKNHDHTTINSVSSAKMSIPFSVAAAFMTGKAGPEEYSSKNLENAPLTQLTKKVVIHADKDLSLLFPNKTSAIVTVNTKDGNVFTERIDFPKGEPEAPLSDAEIEEKFISLAMYGKISEKSILEVIKGVWNVEDSLKGIIRLL